MMAVAGNSELALAPPVRAADGMGRVIRVVTRLNRAAAVLAAILLWALAILIFGDIVLRFAGTPILWSNEISVYLLIAVVYLGIGYTYDKDGHFAILLLVDRLSRKSRLRLELATVLLSLVFAILLTIGGAGLVQFARSLSIASPTLLHVPLFIPYSCVVVGGLSLSLSLVCRALNIVQAMRSGIDLVQRTEHSI